MVQILKEILVDDGTGQGQVLDALSVAQPVSENLKGIWTHIVTQYLILSY